MERNHKLIIIIIDRIIASRFVNIFLYLEQQNIFNPDSELHLMALHLVYLPIVKLMRLYMHLLKNGIITLLHQLVTIPQDNSG